MHAIRGLFQQSFSYLVAGEMAAHMMPILQSVFFALVVSMIFIRPLLKLVKVVQNYC
ncbi:conjugal transfer protein TraG [Orientia tsutsugamushi]|nr:conjugal transfer protein TraG [Orientia tsutsugamushi]